MARAQGQAQQGQQGDLHATGVRQEQKPPEQLNAPGDTEIRAALVECDEKNTEPGRQTAETSKSTETAKKLATDIEAMHKANKD